MLSKLIEALQILNKYADPDYPTHCEHDVLMVHVDPALVTAEDLAKLDELGFIPSEEFTDSFISFYFGSS